MPFKRKERERISRCLYRLFTEELSIKHNLIEEHMVLEQPEVIKFLYKNALSRSYRYSPDDSIWSIYNFPYTKNLAENGALYLRSEDTGMPIVHLGIY